jgi:pimeloyl-ACP methyl ester carboxylesterase
MPTIDIQGTQHRYDLTPTTPSACTFVFIHGWLWSRHYWQPLIHLLAPNFQCLSYDLRGFGDSSVNNPIGNSTNNPIGNPTNNPTNNLAEARDYSAIAYAQDLLILLQKLKIPQVWLVGHGWGGEIALWSAALLTTPLVAPVAPTNLCIKPGEAVPKIQGVTCLHLGGGIYWQPGFDRHRVRIRHLLRWRARWLAHCPGLDWVLTRIGTQQHLPRHWGRQRLKDLVAAHPQATLETFLSSTTETAVHQLPQILTQLTQPILFISGLDDRIVQSTHVRHLASFQVPSTPMGTNVLELENCGHLSMLEQTQVLATTLEQSVASWQYS